MKRIVPLLLAAIILLPAGAFARSRKQAEIKVISYNIRVGTAKDGDNSWKYRYAASGMMLNDRKPDIFGLQEAIPKQKQYLDEALPEYESVGVPRTDGKSNGEIMAIFWNTNTIKMIEWGTYWLSETPEVPSKGWDAAYPRTATWALMKDRKSGRKFFYVNTHLDHVGWEARKNGLALIVDKIAEMNPRKYPMVLTGDFNMTIDRQEFDGLKERMKNAREEAAVTDSLNTYNSWGKMENASIIDYIWYSGWNSCTKYETITTPYDGRTYISDHFPIAATLVF